MREPLLRGTLEAAVHAAALLYLPVALARTRKRSGYLALTLARMGAGAVPQEAPERAPKPDPGGFGGDPGRPRVVVHACSVGETLAILPLLERLREAIPGVRLLHTVTTETGYDLARKRSTADRVRYLPVDVRPGVAKFLDEERPDLFVAVETELWPVLFFSLARRGIPIALANGRISDRSFPRYERFRPFTREVLRRIDLLLMQSAEDATRAIRLGADPRRVVVPGNVKYDALEPILADPAPRHRFGFPEGCPLFVFGSVHPGEEAACLAMMRAIRGADPRVRFLLAPRKFDRLAGTLDALAEGGFRLARWSKRRDRPAGEPPDLLVLDTLGELVDAYRASDGAFVGGSFVASGGHNILEVSACGKAVFHGPHMENFREIAALAREEGFAVRFADPGEASRSLAEHFRAPERLAALGGRAREALARRVGASRRSARLLASLLPRPAR